MELERQVCSLELAKKLKELGVKQQSLFYWKYTDAPLKDGSRWGLEGGREADELMNELDMHSAFTVAELGEMLSKAQKKDFIKAYCEVMGFADINHSEDVSRDMHNVMTQPDIAAGMLIYLIENKLITV